MRMSSSQKALTVGGLAILVAALVWFGFIRNRIDPPIIVGDGSITLQSLSVKMKSTTELEVTKFLHKVRTITVVDTTTGASSMPIDVKGRDWILTSASATTPVSLSPDPQLLGAQEGVKADCPTPWTSGTTYICVPADNSQLTPATLKFNKGNCPATGTPTCPLSCTS